MEHTERKITALTVQKRDTSRVNVYLDGEYAFGLAHITAAWLRVGQVLTEEKIAELKAQDAGEVAYQHALRLLNFRDRTENEIVRSLKQRQTPEEVIAEVLARLRRGELLDDQRFAKSWVENRTEFRPRSSRALAYELREKGINQEAIQEALESFDDEEAAYLAARKYARRIKKMEWPEFRQKLLGYLSRRGFHYDTSNAVIARVQAEIKMDESTHNTLLEEVDR